MTAAAATTPRVISIQPAPGAQNQPPNVVYTATITNGTSKVVAGSVELSLNSSAVTHHVALQNDQATVTYTNSALYPAGAVNIFRLVFADDASPANRFTNEVTFTIANYRNIVLPAPLHFENFDSTPEEQLPVGWSQTTFTTEHADVARYTDPDTFEDKGGTYGAFIGAAVSQDLAPFIEGRVDDDPVESKRIEFYRLAEADNQTRVRFRFAHAGTDSWYFGVDDFGLYSLGSTPAEPPTLAISRSGDTLTIAWPANTSGFVLEASPTVSPAAWTALSGVTGNSASVTASGAAMFYRLRQ